MPFKIKFADITKYQGDAIVNSIGINGSVKGALCNAILKEANSKELTSLINSKVNNKVGEMFITKGYNLACENIIHVISPFKKDDDSNNSMLKNIYIEILKTAVKQGYNSIAIPFLGTGANGYLDSDAYDCISSVCASLLECEEQMDKDIIDVTLIVRGNQKLMEYQKGYDRAVRRKEEFLVEKEYKTINNNVLNNSKSINLEGKKVQKNTLKCIKFIRNLDPTKFVLPKMLPYKYDYDFVEDYIYQNNINDKILAKDGLDRKIKCKMRKGQKLKKIDIYRFAYSLKMEKEVVYQFMMMCNLNFNPDDELDMFYIDYLSGKYQKAKTIVYLSQLSFDKCGRTLHW